MRLLWWWAALPLLLSVAGTVVASSTAPACPRPSAAVVIVGSHDEACWPLPLRRPLGDRLGVIEGDDATLARAVKLLNMNKEDFAAVLFYASWCPFSQECRLRFEKLAFIFPTIRHFAFEESTVRSSTRFRYGIHAYPTFFLINSTVRVRYHGPRTVKSLAAFYSDVSGINPSTDLTIGDDIPSLDNIELKKDSDPESCPLWSERTSDNIPQQDNYLALAISFVILRLLFLLYPTTIAFVKRTWSGPTLFTYLEQGRQKINRVYPSKQGSLHHGAKNATAWASKSLASVSIEEKQATAT
ncbi:5'-adenylylsulfate reductase-like 2 [Oryza brachyantha]|uniref:Thioredoxin domain-containing protein n=1 Tax=Oryza brachyantha TaxID=4533 RepID=J3MCI6_ORYBR|nr:5'-adenylylsulfate reductase-like 2 [Oryza brachyantha]